MAALTVALLCNETTSLEDVSALTFDEALRQVHGMLQDYQCSLPETVALSELAEMLASSIAHPTEARLPFLLPWWPLADLALVLRVCVHFYDSDADYALEAFALRTTAHIVLGETIEVCAFAAACARNCDNAPTEHRRAVPQRILRRRATAGRRASPRTRRRNGHDKRNGDLASSAFTIDRYCASGYCS